MNVFNSSIENGIITKDMEDLSEYLDIVERSDLAIRVRRFTSILKI